MTPVAVANKDMCFNLRSKHDERLDLRRKRECLFVWMSWIGKFWQSCNATERSLWMRLPRKWAAQRRLSGTGFAK